MRDKLIGMWGYILIIAGMILAERKSTGAAWGNIIKSEFWTIILVVIIGIITEEAVKYYKRNKRLGKK
ncbi:hypothetical protein [Lacrimispora sp.]|uniref:hypothetical protein n=1 Tax=Lacrimispora sp. TaxID=2719234 RepID=UPI0028B16A74|nr:hypothetical protein [Lacrimispora sp.]